MFAHSRSIEKHAIHELPSFLSEYWKTLKFGIFISCKWYSRISIIHTDMLTKRMVGSGINEFFSFPRVGISQGFSSLMETDFEDRRKMCFES